MQGRAPAANLEAHPATPSPVPPPPRPALAGMDGAGAPPAPRPGRVALVWFRRDLRVADNAALAAAVAAAEHVVRGGGGRRAGAQCAAGGPRRRAPAEPGRGAGASAPPPSGRRRCRRRRRRRRRRAGRAGGGTWPGRLPDASLFSSRPPSLQVPVFIYAPEEEGQFQPGRCSRWWLRASLASLSADLAALGSPLVLRRAPASAAALAQLAAETGATSLHFNHLYDPISLVRDNDAKATLAAAGVSVRTHRGDALYEPWHVLDAQGAPFSAFDPFWERVREMVAADPPAAPLRPPRALPPPPSPAPPSLALTDLALLSPDEEASNHQLARRWAPGEAGAHAALRVFLAASLPAFDADRAKADRASTSRLSPHLHWGEVSVVTVYGAVTAVGAALAAAGADPAPAASFLRQLAFREYGRHMCFHFPFTHERSLLEHLRAAPWRLDQRLFKAWRTGRTGYPLVDAGMRELWATGWLHNRARVVCASFLVKHLTLPWQWGLKHFWDALLDADLECCALGWQYVSGGLPDGHPFGCLVDPAAEAEKYDPTGSYVRAWLPALARLPDAWIHAPWRAPARVLEDAGVELGPDGDYPFPVLSPDEAASGLAAAANVVSRSASGVRGGGAASAGPASGTGVSAPPLQPPPRAAAAGSVATASAALADAALGGGAVAGVGAEGVSSNAGPVASSGGPAAVDGGRTGSKGGGGGKRARHNGA